MQRAVSYTHLVVFIDTAGLDDEGELGALRVEKTRQAADKTDIALLVLDAAPDVERQWLTLFQEKKIPVLAVLGKADTCLLYTSRCV